MAISLFFLAQRREHLYNTLMRSAVKYPNINGAFREAVFKKILHCSLFVSHNNAFDIDVFELHVGAET